MLDLEDLFALLALDARELLLDFSADHVGDNIRHRRIRKVHRCDVLPISHDGHAVDDVLQLLQPVGDIHDAAAGILQTPDDAEQLVNFLRCQRRGWLVHDQDPGVDGKRLRNLNHLLLGDRKVSDCLARGDVDAQIVENPLCLRLHAAPVEYRTLVPLTPEEHVFRDAQVRAHVQLLMDDCHTQRLRLLRRQIAVFFSENFNASAVSGIHAA